jgi:tetratricopeptide (TPR) repeat protein
LRCLEQTGQALRYATFTVTFLTALGWGAIAWCAPYMPKEGREVLERLRNRPLDAAARELRKLRTELARDPHNLVLATRLARRYVDEARAQGDPRYLGYAQGVLGPWWASPQPPASVLVLRASIRQSNHDFDSALADLAHAVKAVPANVPAWLTRANLLQLKGEYEAAAESCARLRVIAAEFISRTCLASVASMTGRAEASYEQLTQLLESTPGASSAQRVWLETALAEIASRLDRRAAAENHFRRALQHGQPDPYLKGAYADFLLDAGRPADVTRLLAADTRIDALLLRLVLADQALGSPELQTRIANLQARFDAARARGDRIHQREEARFQTMVLKQPREGLRLAQANWTVQKEPADARVLLESALAAGAPHGAQAVIEWMRKNNVQDAVLERLARRVQRIS